MPTGPICYSFIIRIVPKFPHEAYVECGNNAMRETLSARRASTHTVKEFIKRNDNKQFPLKMNVSLKSSMIGGVILPLQ